MQTTSITRFIFFLAVLTGSLVLSSCKREFDEPPQFIDPNLSPTMTIAQLKALHVSGQVETLPDGIIEGIVNADDKSGNYYKQISIQDASGGITIRMDGLNLHANYPVGRKVYVKLGGLYMGDYAGLIQIGGSIDNSDPSFLNVSPIASNLFDTYVIKGAPGNTLTPTTVASVSSLNDTYQSMLIKLENFEFVVGDTSKTYANAATQQSVNLNVKGCGGSSIIVRTSGYANFAGVNVPNGNGTLLAIYTRFNATKQLVIRDTSDVQFNGLRCGAGPTTVINTSELRALHTGTTTSAPNGRRITGVVISDRSKANIQDQNLVLQQGNGLAGITVRFDATHSFDLGDSLDINVSGQELSEFAGLLQVNLVPLTYATRVATGKTITPRNATIAEVNSNFETWESTLIKLSNITSLSGGTSGNWSGSVNLTDATGTMVAFTRSAATFSSTAYPATATSLIGYLAPFNATKQINIRNLNDVVAGGPPPPPAGLNLTTSPYVQNFDGIAGGYPQGVYGKVGATAASLGSADAGIYNSFAATPWNQTSAGVKNFASATGLTAASDAAAQAASTNRAFGFRQTGTATTGGDPGFAYTFEIANTTGKTNFQMSFILQQLDPTTPGSTPRVSTWTVEYGLGDNPGSFTSVTTAPVTLTTTFGTWASTPVTVNFGNALDNQNQKVWIRIVALNATTGSGSRPSTAIDDLQLSWN
ncbi:MAG TPA: DUF5689 domain-containing protein [Chitinophagaceae bacterium]|nr:DUF5689 domain-containing protein [Chitinophagaceae bacterium]